MRVHFCGTRGSTPAPGPEFVRYGGHTSCLALCHDDADIPVLLLDAGTGLRRATDLLAGRPFRGTLLLTHLHWDHVQGIPFFWAGDRDGSDVTLRVPTEAGCEDVDRLLARMMSPPFFPIGPSELRGTWRYRPLPAGTFACEGFDVTSRDVPHKGGRTVGLRVSDGRSSVAYIPDHCPTVTGNGPAGLGEYHRAALELARGVDLLVHDAQLRAEEVPTEGSFGHAAAEYAVGLATEAGARQIALFHHRPDRSDTEIDRTLGRFTAGSAPVFAAADGTAVDL